MLCRDALPMLVMDLAVSGQKCMLLPRPSGEIPEAFFTPATFPKKQVEILHAEESNN